MKKISIIAGVVLLSTVIFISCYKGGNNAEIDESGSIVLYERSSTTSSKSSFFSDHLIKTEKLMKNNPLINSLRSDTEWRNAQSDNRARVTFDNVLLHSYDNSEIRVIEIPITKIGSREEKWMVYVYDNKFIVSKYMVDATKDNSTKMALTSGDGRVFFELVANSENKITAYAFNQPLPFGKIMKKTFSKRSVGVQSSENGGTCPARYPNSFTDCFQCAVSECSTDPLCVIACGLYAASCVVGFSIACA